MGVETPEPIINDRCYQLNFTNEGGVGGTTRVLKNIAGLWLVQRSDYSSAYPSVLAVPPLNLGAVVAVLIGVAPVFVAPPPLTAQNRALLAAVPVTDERAKVAVS